jgi:hypothetical protein
VERLTYGCIPVKGHGYQQNHLSTPHYMAKEDLCDTAPKGDDFLLPEKITNHLGCCNGAKYQINDREIGQEKIHGGTQVRIKGYSDNYEEVSY